MEEPKLSPEFFSAVWKGLVSYRKVPRLVQRIAEGLGSRKIAIVATKTSFADLKLSLLESGLFEEANISHVPPDALEQLADTDLILLEYAAVHSDDTAAVRKKLSELLKHKDRRDGLIVYCKPPLRIPDGGGDSMYTVFGDTPNTVVVTQYGRLLNDILVMMMTTSNQKKG